MRGRFQIIIHCMLDLWVQNMGQMWLKNCASFTDNKRLCNFQVRKQTYCDLLRPWLSRIKTCYIIVSAVLCNIDLWMQIWWLDCINITLRSWTDASMHLRQISRSIYWLTFETFYEMEKVKEVENEDKFALTSVLSIMQWSFTDLGVIHIQRNMQVSGAEKTQGLEMCF